MGRVPSDPVRKPESASGISPLPRLFSKGMRSVSPTPGINLLHRRITRRPQKEPESVARAKVVLAAQLHSEASVTSPTVRFYGPGTELQVVRRVGAWLQVSDPVTQERGWVLDEYLSSIGGPTPAQVATETITKQPTVIKPAIQKSSKRSRSAKAAARRRSVVIANADPWNDRWARRADRRRGFGLFMFRPVPRFAQGRLRLGHQGF
jgi:hypothetical protein